MSLTTRIATTLDAAVLSELAGATFALACPPHTTPEAIDAFIAEHFTQERFAEHLADPDCVILIAESGTDSGTDSGTEGGTERGTEGESGSAPDSAAGTGSGRPPVGYSLLLYGEPTDADVASSISLRPTVQLSKFYTRAEAHGTGVAAPLMQATLAEAARRPVTGIWLGVNEENTRAIRFYEKSGFAKVGRKHFLVGDRQEDDDVLERPLG
ncbi:GNAT family N-acetyltransferase [Glaciibacter flavus]|uniref:GNAT family N-acetyltransferase n=1 Tax=Orlajensenia flava TaxID=2565934 RepID=A0A4S4FVF9_9MICO|nr:GNAT family N-acetyltransferase [Glaciibacter flavus]THG34494.1 GNAT family N-acetyltransferase [Glaciibacter flavus]